MKQFKYSIAVLLMSCLSIMWCHAEPVTEKPILTIGASLVKGIGPEAIPFATNFGSYMGLGDALISKGNLVINEAVAGSGTFEYTTTLFGPPITFPSYQTLFDRAIARVTNPFTQTINADYIVIALPGNCMHSGFPDFPCGAAGVNTFVDEMISIGNQALALGITPIYDIYIKWEDIDVNAFLAFGIAEVIDEAGWNEMRTIHMNRIGAEIPDALQVDMWAVFEDLGDGIHPDLDSAKKAAIAIKQAINAQ